MKKTIDLTNVTRLRSKLRLQMDAMKVDEASVTMQELEVAAKKACLEITGLEFIATPTTWNDFLMVLEKNNTYGYSALGPDIDPITPHDEPGYSDHAILARRVKWMPGSVATRGEMIQRLELWRLEAVELELGLCALKLMEAKEDLIALGEPELPAQVNNIIGDCLMRMAEKKSQNIMAGRYGTRALLRNEQPTGRLKGLVRTTFPQDEMPSLLRDDCKNKKYHDKPTMAQTWKMSRIEYVAYLKTLIPEVKEGTAASAVLHSNISGLLTMTDEEYNWSKGQAYSGLERLIKEITFNDTPKPCVSPYLQATKPEGYNITLQTNQSAVDEVNAQKLRTKTFVNIVPQEQAVRMVNDLQHLINITDDDAYAEALSNEVRRLSLFANGDVKSILDVNFAWTYHE